MLQLDLKELEREGSLQLHEEVSGGDGLWSGADLCFKSGESLSVRIHASMAGTGKVLVRGTLRTTFRRPCRRCLDEVDQPFDAEMTVLYASPDEVGGGDEEVRALKPRGHLLDVSEAVREEVILAAPRYALCDPDCRGLCPKCGARLNEMECDCTLEERDPRWDALRELVED